MRAKGKIMASDSRHKDEVKTYEGFLAFMKWGTIVSLGLGALVVLLISS